MSPTIGAPGCGVLVDHFCPRPAGRCVLGPAGQGRRFYVAGADGAITKSPASMSKHFMVRREPVEDISDLACVLEQLAADPCSFVIRGEPVPGIDFRRPVRRLKYPDPDEPRRYSGGA